MMFTYSEIDNCLKNMRIKTIINLNNNLILNKQLKNKYFIKKEFNVYRKKKGTT